LAHETTTALLPCADIDETADFYAHLGFRRTYRQRRPYGYLIVAREDLVLHFFGLEGLVAQDCYGSCLVGTPDAAGLYEAFRDGLRSAYGRLPTDGFPRLTRPRKKGQLVVGFSLVDPNGNWIRVHATAVAAEAPASGLAGAIETASRLADGKGDPQGAARVLDTALPRHPEAPAAERVAALATRAELAVRLGDRAGAAAFLRSLRSVPLDESTRLAVADEIERAANIAASLAEDGDHAPPSEAVRGEAR